MTSKEKLADALNRMPRYGVTMGVARIMQAKRIIFVAKGTHKAEIINRIYTGPITESVPGSVMRLHPNVTMIIDEQAAGLG